jgi:hypothetical protein
MRKVGFLAITLITLGCNHLFAANVVFKANAPSSVVMGTAFQLVYSINTLADPNQLRTPSINGFDIVAGPFTARSEQSINGQYSSSMTFTLMLMPKKEGNFSITPAYITLNGQRYASNGLSIKVLPPDKNIPKQSNRGGINTEGGTSFQSATNQDVFIRANVSKTNVFEQEAFLITYKLYSIPDIVGFEDVKFPDFKNFVMQQIDLSNNRQTRLENYNGHNYTTAVIYQVLLFPQRSGVINIDRAACTAIIRLRNQQKVRSIFDDFFDTYQDVKKILFAPPLRINVQPLPLQGKPASFSGAVGNFQLSSSLSKTIVKTNEAVTLQITLSGTGNMKLINNLPVVFPHDFDTYEPKVDNNYRTTQSGITGTKTIDYLAIPRQAGDFVIAPVSFSYFDVATHTYKTLSTPEYKIHVDQGAASNNSVVNNMPQKENIKLLNQDIRYIDTNNFHVTKQKIFLIDSSSFWLIYLISFLLAVSLFWIFRKQARDNANIALRRTKKANKMALKRLKMASIYLKENNNERFYEEVLKANWGYMSDKLSIPMADLTKQIMEVTLRERSIDEPLIQRLMELLNTCEFAQYAPASGTKGMDQIFKEAVSVIEMLENQIK